MKRWGACWRTAGGAKATTIDGYSNFLFLNRDGNPKTNINYATMFRWLAKKYNKCHEEALPKVMTPHTLRHTFCTNLANAGMNPKALQYIMGHSNITMTVNHLKGHKNQSSYITIKSVIHKGNTLTFISENYK